MDKFIENIKENKNHVGWFQCGQDFSENDERVFEALKLHTGIIKTIQLEYSRFNDNFLEKFLNSINKPTYIKNLFLTHCHEININIISNFMIKHDIHLDILDLDTTNHNIDTVIKLIHEGRIKYYDGGSSGGICLFNQCLLDKLNKLYDAQTNKCYINTQRLLPNIYRYNGAFKPKNDDEKEIKQIAENILRKILENNKNISFHGCISRTDKRQ